MQLKQLNKKIKVDKPILIVKNV